MGSLLVEEIQVARLECRDQTTVSQVPIGASRGMTVVLYKERLALKKLRKLRLTVPEWQSLWATGPPHGMGCLCLALCQESGRHSSLCPRSTVELARRQGCAFHRGAEGVRRPILASCLPAGSPKPGRRGDAPWCEYKKNHLPKALEGARGGDLGRFTLSSNPKVQRGPCQNSRVLGSGILCLLFPL